LKSNQNYMKKNINQGLLIFILITVFQSVLFGQTVKHELAKDKQTSLDLYVTAKEAYDMWKANPDKVKILDVRIQDEYIYIGHATMAWNIPAFLQTYEWDADKHHFSMKPNPDFLAQVKQVFKSDDIILITCRSGTRSAVAANQMAAAGFKNVYNITDGFEGDMVEDPQSLYTGQRLKNGWKNSGIPWTYKIDPNLMMIPINK
jgi:rhodanese-related sulfurtransferase